MMNCGPLLNCAMTAGSPSEAKCVIENWMNPQTESAARYTKRAFNTLRMRSNEQPNELFSSAYLLVVKRCAIDDLSTDSACNRHIVRCLSEKYERLRSSGLPSPHGNMCVCRQVWVGRTDWF